MDKLFENLALLCSTKRSVIDSFCNLLSGADADRVADILTKISRHTGGTNLLLFSVLQNEFEQRLQAKQTILRGNTLPCKILDVFIRQDGEAFISSVLGPIVRAVISSTDISFEIDPSRIPGDDDKVKNVQLIENQRQLFEWSSKVVNEITLQSTIDALPPVFVTIAEMIASLASGFNIPQVALISNFIILRAMNPAIVVPEKCGIVRTPPDMHARRKLILLSKVLQNTSNVIPFGAKESYMTPMNAFIETHSGLLMQFVGLFCKEEDGLLFDLDDVSGISPKGITSAMLGELQWLQAFLLKNEDDFTQALKEQHNDPESASILSSTLRCLPPSPVVLARRVPAPATSVDGTDHHEDEVSKRYDELMRKSRTVDFTEIREFGILKRGGVDKQQRKIMMVFGSRIPAKTIDLEHLLMFLIRELDHFVEDDYVIIYFHSNFHAKNRPEFRWLREVYAMFNRKYKKNLKSFNIVHPTFWLKLMFQMFRPFISSKFWRKLRYCASVTDLFVEISPREVSLPMDVLAIDAINSAGFDPSKIPHMRPCPMFGIELRKVCVAESLASEDGMPLIVSQALHCIERKALAEEGIFRLSPTSRDVDLLKKMLEFGITVDWDSLVDPHLVGGILKQFLRDLPDPLLTFGLFDEFLKCSKLFREKGIEKEEAKDASGTRDDLEAVHKRERKGGKEGSPKGGNESELSGIADLIPAHVQQLRSVVWKLPESNFRVLKELIRVLSRIEAHASVNRMSANALAIVFGPSLLHNGSTNPLDMMKHYPMVNEVIELLIKFYDYIFEYQEKDESTKKSAFRETAALRDELIWRKRLTVRSMATTQMEIGLLQQRIIEEDKDKK
eukprot:TRINITY_DN2186_c1_g1_i1.p1 TRINITY_DN2186_c1_g1~~TRINITY_DN2186_c1_g1_i1.p1  ORF type:complete len:845 (+),score=214.23 TRINITY_DN2186_c1_g1_i1:131-2665(+)